MKSTEERIAAWLDAIPGAISGSGGHNQTFRVACALFNGWGLSESETLHWLEHYNQKCNPLWSASELKHKAADATKAKHTKPRGHLLRDEPWFRTAPVPIRRPAEDTRQTAVAQIPHGSHTTFSLFTHACNTGEPTSRVCEKRKSSVRSVRKSEGPHTSHTSFSVSGSDRTEKTTNFTPDSDPNLSLLKSPVPPENSKTYVGSVRDTDSGLTPEQLAEANRIASELAKLHARGVVKDATDPEARFYAVLLHQSGGTVVDGDKTKPDGKPAKLTAAQKVHVPYGLRGKGPR